MNTVSEITSGDTGERIGSAELRRLIEGMVRRRIPEVDVQDVVQTVLCDALASDSVPDGDEELRRWISGITRHKVADFHRRGGRAKLVELSEQLPGEESPTSAREWARWADEQTEGDDDAKRTLGWMAREGGGEKLAHIAADEKLPATQVRQRVSRLRRFMRQQWATELAAVAAVAMALLVAWYLLREPQPVADPVTPEPVPEIMPKPMEPHIERARELRADAIRDCDNEAWQPCLDGFDEAARLDPAGDADESVRMYRGLAGEALRQQRDQRLKRQQEQEQKLNDPKLNRKRPTKGNQLPSNKDSWLPPPDSSTVPPNTAKPQPQQAPVKPPPPKKPSSKKFELDAPEPNKPTEALPSEDASSQATSPSDGSSMKGSGKKQKKGKK